MRFLLDEMIPRSIERLLKSRGYQVIRPPLSMSNSEIISMASEEDAIIITADKDFITHVSKEYDYVIRRVVIIARRRDWRKITRAFAEKFDEIVAGFRIDPVVILKESGYEIKIKHGVVIEFM